MNHTSPLWGAQSKLDLDLGNGIGTEVFVPALLNRPNFDVTKLKTPQEIALFLSQTTLTPGQ